MFWNCLKFICNFTIVTADFLTNVVHVMFTICQQTVSSTTNNGDWFECVDETQSHMKPAVVPETTIFNR